MMMYGLFPRDGHQTSPNIERGDSARVSGECLPQCLEHQRVVSRVYSHRPDGYVVAHGYGKAFIVVPIESFPVCLPVPV